MSKSNNDIVSETEQTFTWLYCAEFDEDQHHTKIINSQ
jgi:hypothetical protein